jgi:spoIIIJ-associated protein
MRNFSNQSSGKPSSGKPSGGNRGGGYRGPGGGFNRDSRPGSGRPSGNREGGHRDENRGPRSGGYRGNSGNSGNSNGNRFESRPSGNRRPFGGGNSYGNNRPGGRFDRNARPERTERHDRGEGYQRGSSWVEVYGRTAEEAIDEAAKRFNVNRNDLKTELVDEGNKGFLGIGSKPAKVRVALKPAAVMGFAEGILVRLLRGMDLPDAVKSRKDEDGNLVLNIEGPSSGTLIGRHGHTLDSLQYLVAKVVQRLTGDERSIIIVDVENYLERQKDKLKELAVNLAEKAKETGVDIPMRPMSSKDRRVVHLTLKDHEHVTTESQGEGLRRRVVVIPKVKAVVQPAAPAVEGAEGAPAVEGQPEPGNIAPVEHHDAPVDGPEPGNVVPPEPNIDDNIGNRVM